MNQTRFTWLCDFSGQPRAYADTETRGSLICERTDYHSGEFVPFDVNEAQAKRGLRAFLGFIERSELIPNDMNSWFEPYLDKFEKIAPGVWNVRVVRRYDD